MLKRQQLTRLVNIIVFVMCLWAFTVANRSLAAESVQPAGPIGASDIRSALLPPPGFYIGGGLGTLDIPEYYDDDGDSLDATGYGLFGGVGVTYVYKKKIFGGRIASAANITYNKVCLGVADGPEYCNNGLGDLYTDLIMWSRMLTSGPRNELHPNIPYGLAIKLGLGLGIPVGTYDPDKVITTGANFFDLAPNIALTFTTPSLLGSRFGDATEISGRFYTNFYSENSTTNYQSGTLWNLSWAVTQIAGPWHYGVAGNAYDQFSDDELNGITVLNGNRASQWGLGPLIARDFIIAGRPWFVKGKGVITLGGRNQPNTVGYWLTFGTKF